MSKQQRVPESRTQNSVPAHEHLSWGIGVWATLRGISRAQAYLEVQAGRLQVFHVGRRALITRQADAEWEAARRAGQVIKAE
jgi:hypothetical protein